MILLGNWASSQDHSKQFIKQQIKLRIHQSHKLCRGVFGNLNLNDSFRLQTLRWKFQILSFFLLKLNVNKKYWEEKKPHTI